MLYGCCDAARDRFIDRLEDCDFAAYHPLTLPTIFAEVERKRLLDLVDPLIAELVERVKGLDVADEQKDDPEQLPHGRQTDDASKDYVQLWLQISWLKNGLEDWKRQLQKMITHCEELQQASFDIPDTNRSFAGSTESTPVETTLSVDIFDEKKEDVTYLSGIGVFGGLDNAGRRIHQKLLELEEEYNEKIRACSTIIDGMALAAQVVSH